METENGEDLIGVARVEICAELKVDAKEKNGKKQSENKFSFFLPNSLSHWMFELPTEDCS